MLNLWVIESTGGRLQLSHRRAPHIRCLGQHHSSTSGEGAVGTKMSLLESDQPGRTKRSLGKFSLSSLRIGLLVASRVRQKQSWCRWRLIRLSAPYEESRSVVLMLLRSDESMLIRGNRANLGKDSFWPVLSPY